MLAEEVAVATDAAVADPTEDVAETTIEDEMATPTEVATTAAILCCPADSCGVSSTVRSYQASEVEVGAGASMGSETMTMLS